VWWVFLEYSFVGERVQHNPPVETDIKTTHNPPLSLSHTSHGREVAGEKPAVRLLTRPDGARLWMALTLVAMSNPQQPKYELVTTPCPECEGKGVDDHSCSCWGSPSQALPRVPGDEGVTNGLQYCAGVERVRRGAKPQSPRWRPCLDLPPRPLKTLREAPKVCGEGSERIVYT
jgi:hypothetical protein